MAKKFGLGKGLGALIPEDNIKEEKKEKGGIINIELKDIKANKKQPRKFFDNNKLNELAESVKEHGIIQPLILKKEEKGYSIIAGERRYRAAKIAELTGNTFLSDMVRKANLITKRFLILSGTLQQHSRVASEEHEKIIYYLEKGDFKLASKAMEEHLDKVNKRMLIR